MIKDCRVVSIAVALCVYAVFAAETLFPANHKSDLQLNAGGDIRSRYEFKDNWMSSGQNKIGTAYEDYLRLRTRLWGQIECQRKYNLFLRLDNEFRYYRNSTKNKHRNEFPDEVYVGNLYFDIKNVADRLTLRIGRQDITLGAGRVVKDGTPGDGSRSLFFDALRSTIDLMDKSTIELIGIYNHYRDHTAIGNGHNTYDMTRIHSGSPHSKMDEMAYITYLTYNECENFPMEFYYIWKRETRFYDKNTRYPGRSFHTLGTRLNPSFTEKFSGELESAVQMGKIDRQSEMRSRDILAWMTYAALSYSENKIAEKPKGSVALLYLSGDKKSYYKTADGSTDNGWNPVFNRSSWFSEICASMYDKYRWSNLVYPHMQARVEPHHRHSVEAWSGPMFAAARDHDANSSYRGYFSKLKYEFPLLFGFFAERASLKGALVGEMLYYGNYYEQSSADNNVDAAYWLRFEIKGRF